MTVESKVGMFKGLVFFNRWRVKDFQTFELLKVRHEIGLKLIGEWICIFLCLSRENKKESSYCH